MERPKALGGNDAAQPHEAVRAAVRHAADLARLHVHEDRLEDLARDVEGILSAFATLEEVGVEGVDGMARVVEGGRPPRADVPAGSLPTDVILRAAPRREDDFYSVPSALGEGPSKDGAPKDETEPCGGASTGDGA